MYLEMVKSRKKKMLMRKSRWLKRKGRKAKRKSLKKMTKNKINKKRPSLKK